MLQSVNKENIAKELGIERKTIYNWMKNPEFMSVYDRLAKTPVIDFKEKMKKFRERMFNLLDVSADTLDEVLKDPTNKGFAKCFDTLCRVTGAIAEQTNYVFIVLQSNDPYGQCRELMKQIEDRVSMLSDEQRQSLLSTSSENDMPVIDSDEQLKLIVDDNNSQSNKVESGHINLCDQDDVQSKHDYDHIHDERDSAYKANVISELEHKDESMS